MSDAVSNCGSNKQCLVCGYTLDNLTATDCPECGTEFDSDDPNLYVVYRFRKYRRVALLCGIVPLVIGTAITVMAAIARLGFRPTDQSMAVFHFASSAGFFVLLIGALSFLLGIACLLPYCMNLLKFRGRDTRRVLIIGMVLLANLPAAELCLEVGEYLNTLYSVTVINESSTDIDSCIITCGAETIEFGPIAPGGTVWHIVSYSNLIEYDAQLGDEQVSGSFKNTLRAQGYYNITIKPSHSVSVTKGY